MSNFVAIRNGGATDEQGALRLLRRVSTNDQGVLRSPDMKVGPHGTPNNTVDIAVGDIAIAYQSYLFHGWSDAINNITITNNSSGNPRIDALVAYIDLSVVSSSSNNNPGALKFMAIAGTPAGSPVIPNNTVIQAAVGAGNPFYVLEGQNVPTGFTGSSTITNSGTTICTDLRTVFLIGSNTKYGFFAPGVQTVTNDISWDPSAPAAQTVTTLNAYVKTPPVGSGLTFRVWNITQAQTVGSVTIAAGSNFATAPVSNGSLNAGDVLRLDATAIGSTTPGSDGSVIVY